MYQPTPLDHVINKLKSRYGHQVIRPASQVKSDFQRITTGVGALDTLLQGGILVGMLNEFTGKPTSGTTSIIHHTAGHVQKQGYEVVYIDLEQCFDPLSALSSGVNMNTLLIVHPSKPIHALKLIRDISIQQIPCLVVLDAGDIHLGTHYNRIELQLAQSASCVVTLTTRPSNQAQVEVMFKRLSWLYTGKDVTGYRIRANLNKHPMLSRHYAEFDLRFVSEDKRA